MGDLVSMLGESVARHADRPLFGLRSSGGWSWVTYADFARSVDALRSGLASAGLGRGDRVAVISRNRVEWAVGCYAVAGLGGVYVPMYEAQAESDWRHILADSGARACLMSGGAVGPGVRALQPTLPALRTLVDFDGPASDPGSFMSLIARGERHPLAPVALRGEDLAELVYTSGTTGAPKGVRLTHANVVSNVDAVLQVLPVTEEDSTVAFLPWAHVFGGDELHGVIALGASLAICESVDELARDLAEVRPTLLFAVPRVWNRIYQGVMHSIAERPRAVRRLFERAVGALHRARGGGAIGAVDTFAIAVARRLVFARIRARLGGRLRYAVSAAAALAPEVAELIDDAGIVLLEAYGLTETSACATINRPDARRIGSVGKPVPGVRVAIDRGVEGASGDVGEIVVYGHGVMAGYENLPEQTARTLTADGGLRTGDLGRVDADGFLHVTGRVKELYKLENGKYVAPAPLEERLTLSPFIEQAFVHGANRPHNVALIVPSGDAVREWAREHGLPDESPAELLGEPRVRALLREEIDAAGADFKGFERIRAFELLGERFSPESGLLTPTLKVRRAKVLERYGSLVEGMYRPLVEARATPPSP